MKTAKEEPIAVTELHVGFTGTRNGMDAIQRRALKSVLANLAKTNKNTPLFFHHGDCVGADDQAHDIATDCGYTTIGHPPANPKLRAFKECDILLPVKDYIPRNHDIVEAAHLVIGAPNTVTRPVGSRSGTWATIEYARNHGNLWKVLKPLH